MSSLTEQTPFVSTARGKSDEQVAESLSDAIEHLSAATAALQFAGYVDSPLLTQLSMAVDIVERELERNHIVNHPAYAMIAGLDDEVALVGVSA